MANSFSNTSYIFVQVCDNFRSSKIVPTRYLRCQLSQIIEKYICSLGKKYQFRVVAVTKAGESDPSQETKPHLCRYKNLSPAIDPGSGGSRMVKLNRMATFQIKVRGEPPPTFTWLKDGQKVAASEGVLIETSEHPDPAEQSTFAILQIQR